jgi:hypothetical protein
VGSSPTNQIGHADLTNDTIESYQKNGITVDGTGSTADIDHTVVTGAGPTPTIAQNGIQISDGATGSVTDSTVTGNNYTGTGDTSATGLLVFGGCGSGLDTHVRITGNRLTDNDEGIGLYNLDPTCTKAVTSATDDLACSNLIKNSHGYQGGVASADANVTGLGAADIGYQAGIADVGNHDVICDNAISGPGYAPLGATSSLPSGTPPAFVRPIDTVSGPAVDPLVYGNSFDGSAYHPA